MKTFYPKNRNEWRSWLRKKHKKELEVVLIFYKRHTGKPSITYQEALEEAICFGWIDGLKRRLDEERYTYRFTPRKKNSKWSEFNISLAKELIKKKKMSVSGLNAFKNKTTYSKEILKVRNAKTLYIPLEIKKAFKKNKIVWQNFNNLAPSYKKQFVWWIRAAKREETKNKRIKESIRLLKQNKKLVMK